MSLALAASIVATVDQDAVHPSSQSGLSLEAAHGAMDPQKGILDRVFRVRVIAEQVKRHTFHTPRVRCIDLFECTHIAALASLDKARFGVSVCLPSSDRQKQFRFSAFRTAGTPKPF